jgi:sugar phosphate isomerase/epimerase
MTANSVFHVGISFHSFAREYLSFIYSFEDMMEKATLLGRGIEIVGPSHHRGFPVVSEEFERSFKSSVDRFGLTPTSYGSYADPFMLPDRNLTPDELYEYTVPQMEGAARLGFPVVRLQYYAAVVAERLIPLAEKLKIKMGYELHTPLMIESQKTQELIRQIERISSDRLGLIPDCGIFARSISKFHLEQGKKLGVPDETIQEAIGLWKKKTPAEDAIAHFRAKGINEKFVMWLDMVWGSFGYSEPAALAEIKPYINHVHGKFYTIVNGDEPDIRYEEVVETLLKIGYTGWMSTEYEGGSGDSFEICQAHQNMVNGYIKKHLKD